MYLEQLSQYSDAGLFVLRLAVAAVFIYHGLPKIKNSAGMAAGMGVPAFAVILLGLAELGSGIALIIGLWMQLAAIILCLVMLGAIWFKMVKWHVPFFAMDKTGWEFDFILLAANIAILLTGGGKIGI